MKLPITTPNYPDELNIEAEVVQEDASRRITSGIKLTISWLTSNGTEWGMTQYIPEDDLTR